MYYCTTRLRHIVLLLVILFSGSASFGQSVDSLQTIRSQKIAANEPTREVDWLLYQAGKNPTCVIQQTSDFSFTFDLYQGNGSAQREQKMNLRLKAAYPFLELIDFSDDYLAVRITCKEKLTPEMINELVSHFGYIGYETR